MTLTPRVLVATLFVWSATTLQANAQLIDRGGGLIYDADKDITWLVDSDYAKTSGADADGMMTWDEAVLWVDGLTYGGLMTGDCLKATPTVEQATATTALTVSWTPLLHRIGKLGRAD